MKKVLFDCGANIGKGYKELTRKLSIDDTWEVHLFEPNPECISKLKEMCTDYMHIHEQAVHTTNCTMKLFGTSMSQYCQGATLHNSFHNHLYEPWKDTGDAIEVECIDLAKAIHPYIGNEIYIKLDIEGSEYDVAEHLIQMDIMKHVKKIFIEFHDRYTTEKLKQQYELKERRAKILQWLEDNNVEFEEWF